MIATPGVVKEPKITSRASSEDRALDDALANTFPASDPVARLQPATADTDRPIVRPTVATRGAVTGHNVRYVLLYGLVGVVVALAVLYFTYRA